MGTSNSKDTRLIAQQHNQINETKEAFDMTLTEFKKQVMEPLEHSAEEQRKLDEKEVPMENITVLASPIISLNVGGTKSTTTRATLTLIDGTSLATLFSGERDNKLPKDTDGCIFLDYDPFLFNYLLNQLRAWSNPSVKRVFHLPDGFEKLFLQFVRSLDFDDRYIDDGRSVIEIAPKVMQQEHEVKRFIEGERNITTSTAKLMRPKEEVKPTIDDTTTTAITVDQVKEKVKIFSDDEITTTSAPTVEQPKEGVQASGDDGTTVTTNSTTAGRPQQKVEHFGTTKSSDVQVSDNDRRCEKISQKKDWQYVFGSLNYSKGTHRIRFKLEKGSSDILLGICSRNKPPTGSYLYDKPTTHGWMSHGYVVTNGGSPQPGWSTITENDILELTINCDERSLSILNERSGAKNSMQVDINEAPFPWCLLVLFHYQGSRVSFV